MAGETDPEGNNIQIRTLPDGGTYRVIKNFPTRSELAVILSKIAAEVRVTEFPDSRRYLVEFECAVR
jgi:hypothetical protein